MPPPDHNSAQNQFAKNMPAAAETVCRVRQADADADAAVGRNDLEDDIENGIGDRVTVELARLHDSDEENREDDPPQIMR